MPDGQKRPPIEDNQLSIIDGARTREGGNEPQVSDPLGLRSDTYQRRKGSGDEFGVDGE